MAGLDEAACLNADPRMFDVTTFPAALEPLALCLICEATQACMKRVRPQRSRFDGVAAGAVWRNGYRVRLDNSTREDGILRMRYLARIQAEAAE